MRRGREEGRKKEERRIRLPGKWSSFKGLLECSRRNISRAWVRNCLLLDYGLVVCLLLSIILGVFLRLFIVTLQANIRRSTFLMTGFPRYQHQGKSGCRQPLCSLHHSVDLVSVSQPMCRTYVTIDIPRYQLIVENMISHLQRTHSHQK